MSTLSIAPAFTPVRQVRQVPAARTAVPAPSVRLTRRGRLSLVLGFLGLALALMTVFGGWATATHQAGAPEPVQVLTVAPGDTLYGIAGQVAQPGHVREMVLRIQKINALDSSTLQPGQQIAIPRD